MMARDENDETSTVLLASAQTGAAASHTVTIGDDDAGPEVSVGPASVTEGTGTGGTLVFPLTLSAASSHPLTVACATRPNTAGLTDYTAASGTATFAPGVTTAWSIRGAMITRGLPRRLISDPKSAGREGEIDCLR